MKKIISLLSILLIFASCGSSSSAVKYVKPSLKGSWNVTDVRIEGIPSNYVKIEVLDETISSCFIGSHWNFNENSSKGTFQLDGTNGCPVITRGIIWSIERDDMDSYLKFKKMVQGEKAKNILDGYKLKIITANDTELVLSQDVAFEGKKINVIYQFSKNQ